MVGLLGEVAYPSLCNCQRTMRPAAAKLETRNLILESLSFESQVSDSKSVFLKYKEHFRSPAEPGTVPKALVPGGRGWNRTSDLILIRDAL